MSESFVTGSRVYGTPKPDSDIDLVVLVSEQDLNRLEDMATKMSDLGSLGGPRYEDGKSLRFGNLNLLCVTRKKHFDIWKQGTAELKAIAPVTRDKAIEHLAALRRKHEIDGW